MNVKRVEDLIGRNRAWENAVKDYDKDGSPNVLDCAPRNHRKQGILHDIGKSIARKTLKGGARYRAIKYIEKREEISQARREARHEQSIRVAKETEKIKADRRIEYARKGGFWGQVGRQASTLSRPTAKAAQVMRRKKKGKRKTRSKRVMRVRSRPSTDFTSGGSFI